MSENQKRDVGISKALSYLLRHGAVKEKLPIDSNGYVELSQILNHNRVKTHKATIEDINRIVQENDKKRFTLVQRDINGTQKWFICANQGHSIKTVTDDNLTPLNTISDFPSKVVHGTYQKNLSLILKHGLSKMNRNHIHFTSDDRLGDVTDSTAVSGFRQSANVLIYLDIGKCLESGLKFYRSQNNVILSPGNSDGFIEPKLFLKVTDRKGNAIV